MSEEGLQVTSYARTGAIIGALITVAIGVFINYFLYRFAVSTARGMDSMDSIRTNDGFNNLRRYFKIYGVLLIIGLSIAVLGIVFVLIGLAMR